MVPGATCEYYVTLRWMSVSILTDISCIGSTAARATRLMPTNLRRRLAMSSPDNAGHQNLEPTCAGCSMTMVRTTKHCSAGPRS